MSFGRETVRFFYVFGSLPGQNLSEIIKCDLSLKMFDMDVKCIYGFIKRVKRSLKPFWNGGAGESLVEFGERSREWNPRKMRFWKYICCTVRGQMLAEIRYLINKPEKTPETRLEFAKESVTVDTDIQLPIRATDRAPPSFSIFIPLPDAEIGGCARNDSLIAPLVN
ncbi:hypothetical protein QUA00_25610 [Microcoleus sp. T2B6]|uniref:hypothetical protein n=1 Tax=Microcoleus sp. T2B6 TaxID=3055424 RepID=UPI002FD000AC